MKYPKKSFKRNLSGYMPYEFREGELIEEKVTRLTQEKSPINDGAPKTITEVTSRLEELFDAKGNETGSKMVKQTITKGAK